MKCFDAPQRVSMSKFANGTVDAEFELKFGVKNPRLPLFCPWETDQIQMNKDRRLWVKVIFTFLSRPAFLINAVLDVYLVLSSDSPKLSCAVTVKLAMS